MENVEKDINLLDFDDEDRDVVSALMHRIQRMHSLGHHDYVRDDILSLMLYTNVLSPTTLFWLKPPQSNSTAFGAASTVPAAAADNTVPTQ